ncbi:MAG: hypothetical protein F2813_01575 [Actinobacteria bacterium]|nr:hypothetical protein [Actinomycetota bacterium]
MAQSTVPLPSDVRSPFEVYVNGVLQEPMVDYQVRGGALVFARSMRKDKVSGWRWALGAYGVGTYRQDDSIDVRWTREDGSQAVAQRLEVSEVSD